MSLILRAELHVHSSCSDGYISPRRIPWLARRKGLDVVAVTDHDSCEGSHQAIRARRPGDPLIVFGQEVSALDGHVIVLFLGDELGGGSVIDVSVEAHRRGGVTILAHPVKVPVFRMLRKRRVNVPRGDCLPFFDAIEVFNGHTSPLADQIAWLLARRVGVTALCAGSDAHFEWELGNAVTLISARDATEDAIREAFMRGSFGPSMRFRKSRWSYFLAVALKWVMSPSYRAFRPPKNRRNGPH